MYINFILFPLIIILGLCANNSKRSRSTYIIVCSLLLMLECALRSITIGSDTENYYYSFNQVKELNWSELVDRFVERYIYHIREDDIGYEFFSKIISYLTDSFHIFTFLAQLTFFIPLGLLCYRYVKNHYQLMFAYLLYFSLMHVIALSGGRQLYAIGLCVLAFLCYEDRKYKWAIFLELIAVSIHTSALLFLLPIILDRFSPKQIKLFHLLTLLFVPIVIIFVNRIIVFMGNAVGMEKYAAYGMREVTGGTFTFIFCLIILSILIYISIDQNKLENDSFLKSIYCMAPFFTIFGPLIYSNGSMIRVSMYFHLFLILLVPISINFKFSNNKKFIYFVMIIVLSYLSLNGGGLEYYFFWQKDSYLTW